eukprot:5612359-Amphidinium_carterae.1
MTELRWIPHDLNIADSLTKLHGHGESLQSMLRYGQVRFQQTQALLDQRAEERQTMGYNPRPKRQGNAAPEPL